MSPSLTPDQWAKIKRGWVPVAGHLYVNPANHHDWRRVLAVNADGQVLEWVDCLHGCYTPEDGEWPEDAVPCFWGDHATADGLPRTARAMLGRPGLSAIYYADRKLWLICEACAEVQGSTFGGGKTEKLAWLAAILTAPEAQ